MAAALLADAKADIERTLRVGVCVAAGLKRAEICETLGLAPAEVRASMEMLKRAAVRLG